MSTKIYYLDAAKTDSVTARWGMFFRNFRLEYHGQELGQITASELKAGHEFMLPDGRQLAVRLQQKLGAQGLDFQLNGRPLDGTINDPSAQINTGFGAMMLVAGLNAFVSLATIVGQNEVLQQLGLGWASFGEGLVYAGLAWLGKYRQAAWAFYAGLGLLVLDGLFLLTNGVGNSGLVARLFIGFAIYRAAAATRQLRAEQAAADAAISAENF